MLGFFKDELPNSVISEFVVSKPKMYCVRYVPNQPLPIPYSLYSSKKKAKGIPNHYVKKEVTYNYYMETLLKPIQTFAKTKSIRKF